MAEGTVTKWCERRGWGFCDLGDGLGDVFVHHQNIVGEGWKDLRLGERVSLDVEMTAKGRLGKNVRVLP